MPGIRSRPWRPWPALSAEARRRRPREYTSIVYHHAFRGNATGSTGASLSPRLFFFFLLGSRVPGRVCRRRPSTTGRIFSPQCRPRPHAVGRDARMSARVGSRAVRRCWRAAGRGSRIDAVHLRHSAAFMRDALLRAGADVFAAVAFRSEPTLIRRPRRDDTSSASRRRKSRENTG